MRERGEREREVGFLQIQLSIMHLSSDRQYYVGVSDSSFIDVQYRTALVGQTPNNV